MKLKKILITGGNGFLGSFLINELLKTKRYYIITLIRNIGNDENKYKFLKELKGSNKRLQIEESGELGSEENLNNLVKFSKDCDGIVHFASPLILYPNDLEKELYGPAINGNLNVLKAALINQSTIKKVIITSSTAAIVDEINVKENQIFTELDWYDGKPLPFRYVESKYLSEKASIKFIEENKCSFQMIRINPPLIIGPPLNNFPSNSLFLNNLKEIILDNNNNKNDDTNFSYDFNTKMYYNRTIVMSDIRDTIKYYLFVLECQENLHMERLLVGGHLLSKSHSFKEVSDQVKLQFPQLNIAQRLFENKDNSLPPTMPYYLMKSSNISNKINFNEPLIEFSKSIKDSVNYLIENNKI